MMRATLPKHPRAPSPIAAQALKALPFKGRVGWGWCSVAAHIGQWRANWEHQHHPHPGPPLEGEGGNGTGSYRQAYAGIANAGAGP